MSKQGDRKKRMWFGTREYMQWVACPNVDTPASKVGWSTSTNFLNGGAWARSSTASHKEYELTWDRVSRNDMVPIANYADRLYGDGPIYFVDPFTADYNMLPQYLASPFQLLDDGPPVLANNVDIEEVATPLNTLGYPTRSVRFTTTAETTPRRNIWVPIPPGHSGWVGVHGFGATGGAGVTITPTVGAGTGADIAATILPVTSDTRVADEVAGDGLFVSYEPGAPGDSITISGIIVQVLPTGTAPTTGGFASGQGHSGCSFTEKPEYAPYSAAFGNGAVVASLIETEAWK